MKRCVGSRRSLWFGGAQHAKVLQDAQGAHGLHVWVSTHTCPGSLTHPSSLQVGVPVPAVKQRMIKDGAVDPDLLDEDPEKPTKKKFTEEWKKRQAARAAGGGGDDGDDDDGEDFVNDVPLKEDAGMMAYFKMLKVGLPVPVVKHKMTMDGTHDPGALGKANRGRVLAGRCF